MLADFTGHANDVILDRLHETIRHTGRRLAPTRGLGPAASLCADRRCPARDRLNTAAKTGVAGASADATSPTIRSELTTRMSRSRCSSWLIGIEIEPRQ